MPILTVYDNDGNEIAVPAIAGKSAYQYAVANGYTGTEAEFAAAMNPDNFASSKLVRVVDQTFSAGEKAIARENIGAAEEEVVEQLSARMDTFTALEDGSTTGDAELADIRVGYDGTTYSTAGDAVRGQVSQLSEEIGNVENDIYDIIGVECLTFSNLEDGFYCVKLNHSIGETINMTPVRVTSRPTRYCIASCVAGEVFTLNGAGGGGDRLWGFVDENGVLLAVADEAISANNLKVVAPKNATTIILNQRNPEGEKCFRGIVPLSSGDVRYVSVNGSDNNSGATIDDAFATVDKALESGASVVFVGSGTYIQNVNIEKAVHSDITICKASNNRETIFYAPSSIIAETEELVTGYTNVYKANCSKTFDSGNLWIYQDNVDDVDTLISDDERHPLQRGYECRCGDTKIVKVSATTLSEALTEIENSTAYKWFLDSENQLIYFSRPQVVNESNPICGSFDESFINGDLGKVGLTICGITIKYMRMRLDNVRKAYNSNCRVSNVFGAGCYTYDYCDNAVFVNCEASRCCNSTNGDGFNAHGLTGGDVKSKTTHGILVSCWSHDNRDDGFSDHEKCESQIYGGLYEYNHLGAGVTPSTGSHCECHDVYARKNGEAGFCYMGSSTDGGVGGQYICYNCVAENNTIWEGHTQAGFKVAGNNNVGVFVNCKSLGQKNAFYINDASSKITLVDCSAANCTTLKGGAGMYTVKNTEIIE